MGSAIDFTVPPALLRLLRRPWREAMARRDAALVARVWRRVPCEESQYDRNRRARVRARQFLAGLGYEVK